MATLPSPPPDPTLAAVDAALVAQQETGWRPYLGASQIGGPCDRALWYAFRWCLEPRLSADSLRRIADGHAGEALMAERLRRVPGIHLWTVDEDAGQQYEFVDLNRHFAGHIDGVILGLLQAPKTPHVWEHKQVGDAKFRELAKLKSGAPDEKAVLEKWDEQYFIQAQVYLHYFNLTRHFLTVATPGGRQYLSVRTAYQPEVARRATARAANLIGAARPPLRLSDNPADWRCKACEFWRICHGPEIAAVHCRTCAHSTATLDRAPWICEHHGRDLDQQDGCEQHLYHPDLLAHRAEVARVDPAANTIRYRMKDGSTFTNGPAPAMASRDIRERLNCAAELAGVPAAMSLIQQLAEAMNMDPLRLAAGEITEADWPKLVTAAGRLMKTAPEEIEQALDLIDGAYQIRQQEVA